MTDFKTSAKPRALSFTSSTRTRARLVSEIGILNSPFPTTSSFAMISEPISTKLDPTAPIIEEYQSGCLQKEREHQTVSTENGGDVHVLGEKIQPLIKEVLEEKRDSTGICYRVSWRDSWVSEAEFARLFVSEYSNSA